MGEVRSIACTGYSQSYDPKERPLPHFLTSSGFAAGTTGFAVSGLAVGPAGVVASSELQPTKQTSASRRLRASRRLKSNLHRHGVLLEENMQ